MRKFTAVVGTTVLAAGMAIAAPMAANAADDDTQVQILGINDFHGRIESGMPRDQVAGAAVTAGAVTKLTEDYPDSTIFAAAGDQIGASLFASFVDDDKPTIDALNMAGLEISSVGNHEFDHGYDDLMNTVVPRADWEYLGANVTLKSGGPSKLAPTDIITTKDGVKVGFVGAVTEHLDSLVSPKGIRKLDITDIAKATNAGANQLKADGAQIVVMLVHEGYATAECKGLTDPNTDFGKVVGALNGNVDAVISGHTHKAYNCTVPQEQRDQAENPTRDLPVMQAGKYGANLDQLLFTVDSSGEITKIDADMKPLASKDSNDDYQPNYDADSDVAELVKTAVDNAEVLGAVALGKIAGPFDRAKTADGEEHRGGESNLGNLVAQAQLWATKSETTGSAQIAFMNPGGLRTDMEGNNDDGYPAVLTYQQAANVQPFANTLVNMGLTGAQIKTVLEQQWQPEGASRPFLRLGMSEGFSYTYDPSAAKDDHVLQMWLDGTPIDPKTTYSVTVNSFLAAGGDNFTELANGTNQQDTGESDLAGMVDFMAAIAKDAPLAVDNSQRSVGVVFPKDAPDSYGAGDTVKFNLSSLAFPAPKGSTQPENSKVTVKLDGTVLGTFDVDNSSSMDLYDETGTASVSVVLPDTIAEGATLTIEGDNADIGTMVTIPITVEAAEGSTTPEPTTSESTTPDSTTSVSAAPSSTAPSTTAPELSNTGVDVTVPAAMAALLLLFGFGLLLVGRRRKGAREH